MAADDKKNGAQRLHPNRSQTVAICLCAQDVIKTSTAIALAGMVAHLSYQGITRYALIEVRTSLGPHAMRNMAVKQALHYKTDWLLMLDSDMKFPHDTLARLLDRDVDIVGASYPKRVAPHDMLYRLLPGTKEVRVAGGLLEVEGIPGGCLLIRTSVFRQMAAPYFACPIYVEDEPVPAYLQPLMKDAERGHPIGEDYYFCAKARAAGLKVWLDVDLTYEMGHIGEQTWYVTSEAEDEQSGKASVGRPVG